MPIARWPLASARCRPAHQRAETRACLVAQTIESMREEHARQLAAAAEAQRAALEQLREELLGTAGAEAAAREATERERRVEALAGKAMGRIQNAGLIRGWGAWQGRWEEAARQRRMLAGAAARLARPQLAACVAHWRSEWEAEGKAAAAQARKAERSALATQLAEARVT